MEYLLVIPQQWQGHYNAFSTRLSTHYMSCIMRQWKLPTLSHKVASLTTFSPFLYFDWQQRAVSERWTTYHTNQNIFLFWYQRCMLRYSFYMWPPKVFTSLFLATTASNSHPLAWQVDNLPIRRLVIRHYCTVFSLYLINTYIILFRSLSSAQAGFTMASS